MSNYYQKNLGAFLQISFPIGIDGKGKHSIFPLFLPFAGCPHRCIFCAQDKQTGQGTALAPLAHRLENLYNEIIKRPDPSREIAFYGGTFTLLPEKDQSLCLKMAMDCKKQGLLSKARCSTRPDAIESEHLRWVKESGLDLIELGVQSFSDTALKASQRGYNGATALAACHKVLAAGMELGIQMLPGMPGSTPESFLQDVDIALSLHPACLRFYPCLVIKDTPLATLWKLGKYSPWDEATTVQTLGKALAKAWIAKIPVIRLSLAYEADLEAAILAGPRHPALGSKIQGEALLHLVREKIHDIGHPPDQMLLPKPCQGFFAGHRKSLLPQWQELEIVPEKIVWTSDKEATLIWKN